MSNGKAAKPKKPETPEERISELESKFEGLLRRITAYDSIVESFRLLSVHLSEVDKKNATLELKLKSLPDRIEKVNDDRLVDNAAQNNAIVNIRNAIEDYKSICDHKIDKVNSSIQRINTTYNSFIKSLESVSKESLSIDDFKSYQDKSSKDLAEKLKVIADLAEMSSQALKDLKALSSAHEKTKAAVNDHARCIEELHDLSQKRLSDTKAMLAQSERYQAENCQKQIDNIRHEIKLLGQELRGSPSSIAFVRDEVMNELKGVKLEANTATIKSGNAEKEIKLLDKKIENISAKIKKNELS